LADIARISIILPLSFFLNFLVLASFYIISNPKSIESYAILCTFNAIKMVLNTSLQAYYSQNVPREIRATM
jgi:hypothetical protein